MKVVYYIFNLKNLNILTIGFELFKDYFFFLLYHFKVLKIGSNLKCILIPQMN